jgi:hypothetical protein
MASFLQSQQRAVAGWSPAVRSEVSDDCRHAPAPVTSLGASHEFSLATTLAALKRFFTERDDARTWPSAFGGHKDARTTPGVGGTQGRDVAVLISGAEQSAPFGPSHRSSIWGSWQ